MTFVFKAQYMRCHLPFKCFHLCDILNIFSPRLFLKRCFIIHPIAKLILIDTYYLNQTWHVSHCALPMTHQI